MQVPNRFVKTRLIGPIPQIGGLQGTAEAKNSSAGLHNSPAFIGAQKQVILSPEHPFVLTAFVLVVSF